MLNGSELVEVEKIIVTPAQAEKWLEDYHYEKNRPLRRNYINILLKAMEEGQFQSGTSLHFAVLNGDMFLIDGQHRLMAVKESGTPQNFAVVYHKVDNKTDIAFAYSRFDRHQKRNAYDTYRAFGLDEQTGLTKTQIIKGDSAVRFIESGFGRNTKTPGYLSDFDMMEQITTYKEEIKTFFNILSGNSKSIKNPFYRRSTMGVALVTLKFAKDFMPEARIIDFWARSADGDRLSKNDPRSLLRDKMLSVRISGGGLMGSGYEAVGIVDACRYVVLAWNYFIQNKEVSALSLSKTKHYKITGTPYSAPSKVDG